jgi:hypothetical protein
VLITGKETKLHTLSSPDHSPTLLPDNQESELSVEVNVLMPGDISFYKFVSSEFNFDFLKFKINVHVLQLHCLCIRQTTL